jgi:pimeloyl-ACP methyl ester carboxylesterase
MERLGQGRPVVLLHGLADDHTMWRHIAGSLPGAETIALDLPGHGSSPAIPEGARLDDLAATVLATLDAAGLDRVVLVGLSMGGGIAQTIALDAPDRVEALVLVSSSPVFPPATVARFLDRAERALAGGMAAVVDETVPRWFTQPWADAHPDEIRQTREVVLRTDPVAFARASRANAVRDVLGRLPSIDVPVLFVGGGSDPADPIRAAGQYVASIRDLTLHLLPGLSHLIPVEAPDRLLPILAAFIGDLDRRAGTAPDRAASA